MAARLTTYVVVGIVAATLIAGLMVGAQRDDNDGPVDLIVFNGKVYTADGSGSMAEAVAVRGNQILRVGSNRDINRLRRPQTVVVDALGAAVLPGFNDASAHFIDGGVALDAVDLRDAATIDEIQARIRTWAEAHPDRPWIIGGGWDSGAFAAGPTRQLLDAAVADRPAYLLSRDGRAAWLNTKALRRAGITRHTRAPVDGVIVKELRGGSPTGVLKGTAVALAARIVPRTTRDDRARGLRAAIREAHRNGVTSVQDIIARADDFMLYDEARREGDLNVRIYTSINVDGVSESEALKQIEALTSQYPDDPLFKMGGARVAIDGPVESCSSRTRGRQRTLDPTVSILMHSIGSSACSTDAAGSSRRKRPATAPCVWRSMPSSTRHGPTRSRSGAAAIESKGSNWWMRSTCHGSAGWEPSQQFTPCSGIRPPNASTRGPTP